MNRTVRRERADRKARFRAALALARTSAQRWAKDNDISENHLYLVLRGHRESRRLLAKIDAFIALHLPTRAA